MASWGEQVELESLREQAEEVRKKRDVKTGYRPYAMPTCKGISHIFEGFQSMDDKICFREYKGKVLDYQRGRPASVPRLLEDPSSSLSGEAVKVAMETVIKKKIKEIVYIHDPQQDGELDMCIKFGNVYTFDSPIGRCMLIKDFVRVLPGEKKAITVSFAPVFTSEAFAKQALGVSGFTRKSQHEYVRIRVAQQNPYTFYHITLDENFRFHYLSPRDMRFASLDIIAADTSHADLRVVVTSSQKFYDRGETEGRARDYMRDDWVCEDDPRVINTDNPLHEQLTYVSTRKESVYELENPRFMHSAFEKHVKVRVQEATDYDEPRNGRFQNIQQRCEVFMHVTTKEAIAEVVESPDFVRSLLSFAFRMNPQ